MRLLAAMATVMLFGCSPPNSSPQAGEKVLLPGVLDVRLAKRSGAEACDFPAPRGPGPVRNSRLTKISIEGAEVDCLQIEQSEEPALFYDIQAKLVALGWKASGTKGGEDVAFIKPNGESCEHLALSPIPASLHVAPPAGKAAYLAVLDHDYCLAEPNP